MIKATIPTPAPAKSYEIILGKGLKVTKDKKSGTRVVNFPFEFPDETRGVIILCRVKDDEWVPSEDIESITINFK